jgi:hypothetical protein
MSDLDSQVRVAAFVFLERLQQCRYQSQCLSLFVGDDDGGAPLL